MKCRTRLRYSMYKAMINIIITRFSEICARKSKSMETSNESYCNTARSILT